VRTYKPSPQTLSDQLIDLFDPLQIIQIELLQSEVIDQLAQYPEMSKKLNKLFNWSRQHYTAGKTLSVRMIKNVEKVNNLQYENDQLKKRISELEEALLFIQQ